MACEALADGCPFLQILDLSRCQNISNRGILLLVTKCLRLHSLKFLEASNKITEDGLREALKGRGCTPLTLWLSESPVINLEALKKEFPLHKFVIFPAFPLLYRSRHLLDLPKLPNNKSIICIRVYSQQHPFSLS